MSPFISNSQVTQLYIAPSVSLLIYYNGIRRRHRLTGSGIFQPERSPLLCLYENGDEGSFLNLTGFSRASFHELHEYMYRDNELPRTCRPRLLNTEGIIVFYLGSSMTISHLCLIFVCTPSRCSDIVNNQILSLSRRLKNHPKKRIHWPSTLREKEYLAELVHRRESNVLDVIGFTVGLSRPIQCASDPISQAKNNIGYHHDTMINNVFCFAPTGKITFACINFPGSWLSSESISNKQGCPRYRRL